jgi:phage-related protein (TIGR01555 family)
MAWITDSLKAAITACNPFAANQAGLPVVFSHQMAIAAYMSSGLLRKVITAPADDRVRAWRDWQAPKEQIEEIEKEERRLGLQPKVKFAEVLRGIGGGALILVTDGDHAQPLDPRRIGPGGLRAINVVSRWQIQGQDWDRDLASAGYGLPAMWRISGERGGARSIHPSRVVAFRGDPVPDGGGVSDEDAFWGDSRLLRVFRDVQKSDDAHLWFSQLVRKAKLLRIGIPDLIDMNSTAEGREQLHDRIALIATGENSMNATIYRSGTGADDPGEKIDDFQATWTGIPALMDAFDQRVAAVADIPSTRLFGRSPAGMNSTGEHDTENWNKMIASGQMLETRPCLEKIDPLLIRSAGANPDEVTWAFAPLDVPSEKESADTFKTGMEAIEKVQNTGAIPDEAFAKGLQNWLIEREYLPGLDQALADIPENERWGSEEEDEPDPAKAAQMVALGQVTQEQADALLMDAAPRTLYVQRKLLNAGEFIAWAKSQGFETTTPADELHVTVTLSRRPVDWLKMGDTWAEHGDGKLTVNAGGPRMVERLGDEGAVVLLFASSHLAWRHEEMVRNGASWDFPDYTPHVTISYVAPPDLDLAKVEPFRGKLEFGPEIFSEVVEDWEKVRTRDYDPSQPREPSGQPTGGRWSGGGAKAADLTDDQRKAIRSYTEGDYADINRRLREEGELTEKGKEVERILADSSLAEDTTVYRGIGGEAAQTIRESNPKPGDVIRDAGFMSTARDREVAESNARRGRAYGDGIVLEIHAKAGARARDIADASAFGGEREILFQRSTAMRVRRWNARTGVLEVEVDG